MTKKSTVFQIRLEPELKEAAENEADRRGESLASLIRRYLKRITNGTQEKPNP